MRPSELNLTTVPLQYSISSTAPFNKRAKLIYSPLQIFCFNVAGTCAAMSSSAVRIADIPVLTKCSPKEIGVGGFGIHVFTCGKFVLQQLAKFCAPEVTE